MLNIIVKGTRKEAEDAATRHGLKMTFDVERRKGEVIGRIADKHRDTVQAWFHETVKRRPPFETGTVLFWNVVT